MTTERTSIRVSMLPISPLSLLLPIVLRHKPSMPPPGRGSRVESPTSL
jgi:hypothetical protein